MNIEILARLLTPWHAIRRLEAENLVLKTSIKRLKEQAVLRAHTLNGLQSEWSTNSSQLATAREALQRVATGGWYKNSIYSVGYHDLVVEGVRRWVRDGMTGPLPPLPEYRS